MLPITRLSSVATILILLEKPDYSGPPDEVKSLVYNLSPWPGPSKGPVLSFQIAVPSWTQRCGPLVWTSLFPHLQTLVVPFSGRRGSSYSRHLLKWQYFWILIMGPIFISTVKSLLFLANACIITWYYTWNKLWNKIILQIVHRDLRKRNKILPILLCRLKIFHFPYSCPLLEHPPKGSDACIHYFIIHLLTTSWPGVLIPTRKRMCITEKALCHTFPWDGGWGWTGVLHDPQS